MPSPSNGTGAEAADHGSVVDDGDVVGRYLLPQLARQERSAAINRISIDAFEDVSEDRSRNQRIENDRHLRGLHLARAQPPQRALGSDFADVLGRLQLLQAARHRIPVIALHAAVFRLRDGNRRNRTIRPPVFADESVRVRENFVPGGGVE